ncbi:MAG: hypothetical protein K2X28_00565 [Alphaproteobacteria bacterium]|nr:hypothetical protein [Alphaproteobacteria bacterium]
MNLGTVSIVERAESMLKLLFEGLAEFTENNSIKEAALLLENAQLEERVNTFVATLKELPDLEPQQRQLAYLSLKLEPTIFTSFVNSTEKDNLVQMLSSYSDSRFLDSLFKLDQLVPQINQDYGSARSIASTSGPSRSESMDRSYEDYFRGEFLQRMGDSFREYNRSTLSDDAILKVLFPNLPEGEVPSLEVAKARFSELAKAGRPYAKLFTPSEE